MIEGIKIDMQYADLKAHVEARAEFHRTKAAWYRSNVENLRSGGVEPAFNVSNDPASSLKRSEESHEQKCAYFQIISKYLIEGETYRLSESDLVRLEFAANFY